MNFVSLLTLLLIYFFFFYFRFVDLSCISTWFVSASNFSKFKLCAHILWRVKSFFLFSFLMVAVLCVQHCFLPFIAIYFFQYKYTHVAEWIKVILISHFFFFALVPIFQKKKLYSDDDKSNKRKKATTKTNPLKQVKK